MKNYNKQKLEAKAKGEKFYYTGKMCRNWHLSKRWTNNGICVECDKFNKEKNKHKWRKRQREYYLTKTYNITMEEYHSLLKSQQCICKICQKKLELDKQTHLDHCHETKKIRGFLCHRCNVGLGHFTHDPALLRKAALYCEKS